MDSLDTGNIIVSPAVSIGFPITVLTSTISLSCSMVVLIMFSTGCILIFLLPFGFTSPLCFGKYNLRRDYLGYPFQIYAKGVSLKGRPYIGAYISGAG